MGYQDEDKEGFDFEEDEEYRAPYDIRKFCRGLEEAWLSQPDLPYQQIIGLIFDGYNLDQLTTEEAEQMLDDYILQNVWVKKQNAYINGVYLVK